jgi:Proteobacterial lipase chaperone protein
MSPKLMKTRHQVQLGIVGVIALVVSAIWHGSDDDTADKAHAPTVMRPTKVAAAASPSPEAKAPAPPFSSTRNPQTATPVSSEAQTAASAGGVTFRADTSGKIVKDEDTRLNLEKLYALASPAEAQQKLDELRRSLPPNAAEELTELATQFQNYQSAARQAFPPGVAPATPEDALNEIEGQHALRENFFGAQTASAFYGSDEKVQRELLRLMNLEKDQGLTMEEKADRAQQIYSESSELSRITGPIETQHAQ